MKSASTSISFIVRQGRDPRCDGVVRSAPIGSSELFSVSAIGMAADGRSGIVAVTCPRVLASLVDPRVPTILAAPLAAE